MSGWQPAGGARAEVLLLPTARVSHVEFAASLYLPRHDHARDTLAIVLDGAYETTARRTEQNRPGSASVEPCGDRHECRFGPRGARVIVIQPETASGAFERCGELFRERRLLHDRSVAAASRRIASELSAPDESSPLIVEGLILLIVGTEARGFARSARERRPPAWLPRVEQFLRANLRSSIDLATLSRVAGVHPVHLQRVFRAHYGKPIGVYHRHLRLEWAARQIEHHESALGQIALQAGFSDQSHFTRAFARAFGIPPGRWRERAGQKTSPDGQ
jgi:AraC family transcriptional regulator